MIKKILISLISFFVYSHAYAKTAEDILMSNISAEEIEPPSFWRIAQATHCKDSVAVVAKFATIP